MIVAHAQYVVVEPGRAEIALTVADAWQGRGRGTLLLGQIVEAAAARAIHVLEGCVLPDNVAMLQVMRDSGFAVEVRRLSGAIHVSLATSPGDEARRRFEDRERVAAVNAIARCLAPRSVAVIGASRRRDALGATTRS